MALRHSGNVANTLVFIVFKVDSRHSCSGDACRFILPCLCKLCAKVVKLFIANLGIQMVGAPRIKPFKFLSTLKIRDLFHYCGFDSIREENVQNEARAANEASPFIFCNESQRLLTSMLINCALRVRRRPLCARLQNFFGQSVH